MEPDKTAPISLIRVHTEAFWSALEHMLQIFVLFDLILYVPVNNFSVMSGQVFLGWISTKQGLMCLAQGRNAVTPVRLKTAIPRSRVKHFITEPVCSDAADVISRYNQNTTAPSHPGTLSCAWLYMRYSKSYPSQHPAMPIYWSRSFNMA